MLPSVATWPAIDFKRVVLPAPLAPTTATTSPRATSSDTPCNASRPRYEAETPSRRSIALAKIRTNHLRIANHRIGRADRQHASEVEHHCAIDQRQQHLHDVLDHYHCDATRPYIADQLYA